MFQFRTLASVCSLSTLLNFSMICCHIESLWPNLMDQNLEEF